MASKIRARRATVKARLQREQPKTFGRPEAPLRAKPVSATELELRNLRARVAGLEGGQ